MEVEALKSQFHNFTTLLPILQRLLYLINPPPSRIPFLTQARHHMPYEDARQRSQPPFRRFAEFQHGHHAIGLGDPCHFLQSFASVRHVANPKRRAAAVVRVGGVAYSVCKSSVDK
jgi:hypothetical protein